MHWCETMFPRTTNSGTNSTNLKHVELLLSVRILLYMVNGENQFIALHVEAHRDIVRQGRLERFLQKTLQNRSWDLIQQRSLSSRGERQRHTTLKSEDGTRTMFRPCMISSMVRFLGTTRHARPRPKQHMTEAIRFRTWE